MIQLKPITRTNLKECMALKVREDQQDWVLTAPYSLSFAYVHGETAVPFAIYADETPVGFVMLRENREYRNFLLWQFFIDEQFQSRGYGRAALSAVLEWIKSTTDYRELAVSYYEDNEVGGRLYERFGFEKASEDINEHREIDMILRW